jgi:5-dehydro-2-deoxygluconokinase
MNSAGDARRRYLVPIDHRRPFPTKALGWNRVSADQRAQIAAVQQVFYEAFRTAVAAGVPKQNAGLLVDERFGAAILRDAVARGYTVVCPLEKSGQYEFDFENGEDFAWNIEAFQPTFCKVLVRYNPRGDRALNQRQAERLRHLCRYLQEKSRSKFMFELLVPPEKFQLEQLQGTTKAYDLWLRPRLTVDAIEQLQDAGVEPDVWNIEGLDQPRTIRRLWPPSAGMDARTSPASSLHRAKTRVRLASRSPSCASAGFHRLRPQPHGFLRCASLLAGQGSDARRSRGLDLRPVPSIREHFRAN